MTESELILKQPNAYPVGRSIERQSDLSDKIQLAQHFLPATGVSNSPVDIGIDVSRAVGRQLTLGQFLI